MDEWRPITIEEKKVITEAPAPKTHEGVSEDTQRASGITDHEETKAWVHIYRGQLKGILLGLSGVFFMNGKVKYGMSTLFLYLVL